MAQARLTEGEILAARGELPGWAFTAGQVSRSFRFADFSAAWAFMSRVALLAERHDHHPDWSNSYNRVEVSLTTHASGGVTARDVNLARAIDALG